MSQAIVIRPFESGPSIDTPRYWFAGDPFLTHFFNAVSSTFPEGERFFIRAVRHYGAAVPEGSALADAVKRFSGQEARHSREHDAHAELLHAQGYQGMAWLNRNQGRAMGWMNRRLPRASLALTVAIEHVTATFARHVLSRPEIWLAPMHPDMQRLWRWHAVEEAEHKAVAFDVYEAAELPVWLRRLAMADVTVGFLAEIFVRHCYLLAKDRQLRPRVLVRGWRALFGKTGLLRAVGADLPPFYQRHFHPNDIDDGALIERRCAEWGLAAS